MNARQHVSVIGSGFCGTALAIQLLRRANGPLHIQLINRSGRLARGLAYGTRSSSHLLNVPAGRMSLFAEHPEDFLEFVQTKLPDTNGGDFVTRNLYGDYLEQRLAEAVAGRGNQTSFEIIEEQVVDLTATNSKVILDLADGRQLEASQVVIATGNFTPTVPSSLLSIADDPRFIRDPWTAGAFDSIEQDARVLMVGSGLTMFDVALSLQDQNHTGPMLALSRRALLPQPHRQNIDPPTLPVVPESLTKQTRIRDLLVGVRQLIKDAQEDGFDWRDIIAALRPVTPSIWQHLGDTERQRFLRHLRPYWDVHRHRAAPWIATRMEQLLQCHQLEIRASRIRAATPTQQGLRLDVQSRSQDQQTHELFDYVINCTGPCSDVLQLDDPLLNNLHTRKDVIRDQAGLGLETTSDYRLIGQFARPHDRLFLLSPMLKASHWEAIAVPELRQHAANLAAQLLKA
ncbi:FAD/NAD(P)-binding protein [Pseudomonas solani]|uniref:FAD/NAD(P)-binding protein n=1 Tax=Pseudomonas solani TaxID=2731552 RepID=UPI003D6B3255